MVFRMVMLALLVAIAWAFAIADNPQGLGPVAGILAIAVLVAGIFSTSSAVACLARLLKPLFILVLAVPALWMVLQVAPIPLRGFGNQIWATASASLKEPLAERFSVDVHETVLTLSHYNVVVAAALLTAIVSQDRRRAAQVLHMLVSITAMVSALSIWRAYGNLTVSWTSEHAWTGSTVAAIGVILSTAMASRAIDQLRHLGQPPRSPAGPTAILAGAILSLIVSMAAIALCGEFTALIAVLVGVAIVLTVVAIHSWFFGLWGGVGVLASAATLLVASFTFVPIKRNADLTIALSTQTQAATERMLQDTRPIGTGAGTFGALLPIYRDIGTPALRERPTAAAAIAVEMGRTFLCGLLIVTIAGAFTLYKRSLSRNYDYLYPAVGAGTSVSLTMLLFIENGIFDLYASLVVAAVYGLAFAQSLSGAVRGIWPGKPQELAQEAGDRSSLARPIPSATFTSARIRAALMVIGLLLTAQAAWILSQSWHFGDRLLGAAAANSHEAPLAAHTSREDARSNWESRAAVRLNFDESTSALNSFARVLEYSPLRGDVWLMLAAMSKQYGENYDTTALLKMSYYTAPNELTLIPLRLSVALGTDAAVNEPELRDLIRRDLKVAITARPWLQPAVVAAYQSASAHGRTFAESTISELNPSYLQKMRTLGR